MQTVDPKTHLDALVAAVGPARVERLRAATMSRAEAERLLAILMVAAAGTRVDPTAPTLSVAIPARAPSPSPRARLATGLRSLKPSVDSETRSEAPTAEAQPPPATSPSTAETVMPALGRVLGDPSGPPRHVLAPIDSDEPGEALPDDDDALAELESSERGAALLRPPSHPALPAEPPTATRTAMEAIFDESDPGLMVFGDEQSESGAGLVLFGDAMDDAGARFAASPGTDPDVAPLPGDAAEETTSEAVLAGAEAPLPVDDDGAFGFGFGDAEPTVAERRPPLDDEQAQRARRDETLLSSVRKLFGR